MTEDYKMNFRPLEKIVRALKKKPPELQVGILAENSPRRGNTNQNNASIGMKHEFGEDGLPVRSFLRMPLSTKFKANLNKSQAFDREVLAEVVRLGSLVPWMEKAGVVAEATILEAFDTGGFGLWPPSNMAHKKIQQTLVETKQLRDSITHRVKP